MKTEYKITHLYFHKGANCIFLDKEEDGPYHLFSLYLEGDWFPILSLALLPALEKGYWETHVSQLDKIHRNKGYGKAIYSAALRHAIENGMSVCSSELTSRSAKRVWFSLLKEYPVYYDYGRFWLD